MMPTLATRRTIARPVVRFAPSGDITVPRAVSGSSIPAGTYTLNLRVPSPENNFEGNGAQLGELFNQAARQLSLLASRDGSASFVVHPAAAVGLPNSAAWSIPIAVNGPTPRIELQRAMARAAYWSTNTYRMVNGQRTLVPKDNNDGGASIMRAIAEGIADFSVYTRESNAGTAVVPGPNALPASTPPAPPVGTLPLPTPSLPTGAGRPAENRLSRAQIERFQGILMFLGFTDNGQMRADGIIGTHTRAAVRGFQAQKGFPVDGVLTPATQEGLERFGSAFDAHRQPQAGGGGTGGATVVVRPPPTQTPPATRPPPTQTPPAPTQTPPAPPPPAQAGMGSGTVIGLSIAAAAIGVGYAYRKELFGKGGKSRG